MTPELFAYLKQHLRVEVVSAPTPATFGGECPGSPGVKVSVWLTDPETGKPELICEDRAELESS